MQQHFLPNLYQKVSFQSAYNLRLGNKIRLLQMIFPLKYSGTSEKVIELNELSFTSFPLRILTVLFLSKS